jgi:rhodanese-related sulfurtransferase
MSLEQVLEAARRRIRRYTPAEAYEAARHDAVILDIRMTDSRERDGTIPGAYHVPRTVLEWRVASSEWRNQAFEGARLILVCDHGYSSVLAAASLVDLGRDAGDIVGGFAAWRDARLPVGRPSRHGGLAGMGPPD